MEYTPDKFIKFLIKSNEKEIALFLMELNILKREYWCTVCANITKLRTYKRSIDALAWCCTEKLCKNYKKYKSIRIGSLFCNFNVSIREIMRIIIKYSCGQQLFSIKKSLDVSARTIQRVYEKIIVLMTFPNFENKKLGGPGFIVQIDETMLNFKCKSHRGRASSNKSDALCIVEVKDKITRCFATILPIICFQVIPGSVIWTDEHKSYSSLLKMGFLHNTVCHKYEFVNKINGVNTQAVEAFNNELKLMIKRRKGVKTTKRIDFLKEFCFF